MINFDLNPWNLMIDAEMKATISFVTTDEFKKHLKKAAEESKQKPPKGIDDACGVTIFTNNTDPIIFIDADIPCSASVEIIAHEVAHVVAGFRAGHGKLWQAEFDKIFEKYSKKACALLRDG